MRLYASIVAVLAIVLAVGFAATSTASAGEWSRGNDGRAAAPKYYDGTASVCLFNGAEQPDETEPGLGDGEPIWFDNPDAGTPGEYDDGIDFVFGGDDAQWAATPSGGHAQSGGQFVGMYGQLGIVADAVEAGEFQGFGDDCNPNTPHEEPEV